MNTHIEQLLDIEYARRKFLFDICLEYQHTLDRLSRKAITKAELQDELRRLGDELFARTGQALDIDARAGLNG